MSLRFDSWTSERVSEKLMMWVEGMDFFDIYAWVLFKIFRFRRDDLMSGESQAVSSVYMLL